MPPLRRRLELVQLIVRRCWTREPDLAPRAAAFDLADSLAALMDEMQGEGVPPDALTALDVGDLSGHWERGAAIPGDRRRASSEPARPERRPGPAARLRQLVERLADALAGRAADATR